MGVVFGIIFSIDIFAGTACTQSGDVTASAIWEAGLSPEYDRYTHTVYFKGPLPLIPVYTVLLLVVTDSKFTIALAGRSTSLKLLSP